ncbi:MAG: ATP-dependent metallopeptidase FtsH/Yme1/Tma family protein [Rhodopila sp.]|nr:ATP-dependent metallopeptidase FtsH/Yme1/Tma family protein [Rhodopila sp.]
MTEPARLHCTRAWWKRPPVWVLAVVAIVLLAFSLVGSAGRPPMISYGVFLDQLDAANVASVIFHGTEIDGRFKHPAAIGRSSGATPGEAFRSRMPDFGDPTLLSDLRQQHVAIDVASSAPMASWLEGSAPAVLVIVGAILFAKPGILIFGGLLLAGLWRALRGRGTPGHPAMPSNLMAKHPMHGMMKFMSGLFSKEMSAEAPAERAACCGGSGGNVVSAGGQSELSHERS